jgi:hypothetical protein
MKDMINDSNLINIGYQTPINLQFIDYNQSKIRIESICIEKEIL